MDKTRFLLFVAMILLQYGCRQKNDEKDDFSQATKPNIVLILVDDLGKEWVSCYGAEDISTPNVDALAKRGTMFNNVYSMPQCTPTRVTLLTGQYPFRHGWVNHWDVPRWGGGAHFDETLNPSIGMELKKAGYKTCIAGKWQIDDFRVEPDALVKNGFDEYCMWTGYEGGIVASGERYQDPYIYKKEGSKTHEGKFGPDIFRDFIIDFIHANKDSSMFIYFPMVLTHPPLVNTPDESAEDNLGKHKAMVRYTDKITGEIVQALEDANIRDNTIVIWTTDNGTSRGIIGNYQGTSINGGKAQTLESGICEPFVVSWPDHLKSNAVSDALIDFTDFFPTFLEIAGIDPSRKLIRGNTTHEIDGHSFFDVLKNNSKDSQRDWILGMGGGNNARLTENGVENQFNFRDRVIRNKRFKLYVDSGRKPDKFFDLLLDPMEEQNLIDSIQSPDQKGVIEQLMSVIAFFPIKDSDPKYVPNPSQEWDVDISAESQVWKK